MLPGALGKGAYGIWVAQLLPECRAVDIPVCLELKWADRQALVGLVVALAGICDQWQ